MVFYVLKKSRGKDSRGRVIRDRTFSGFYKFDWMPKIKRVALGVTEKRIALKLLLEIVRQEQFYRFGFSPVSTEKRAISDCLEEFLASIASIGRGEQYIKRLRKAISDIIAFCGWELPQEITPRGFEQWRTASALSPKSKNFYQGALNEFTRWLVRSEYLAKNSLEHVQKINLNRIKRRKRKALTGIQIERLLQTLPDLRLKCIVMTAIYTGLRRKEISRLLWSNIQLESDYPALVVDECDTKNGKQAVIPLRPELVEALRAYRRISHSETVFGPFLPFYKLKPYWISAGIPDSPEYDFHALRVTFCTLLEQSGAPPRVAQEAMRHSDSRLTEQTYTDCSKLHVRAAINALPSFRITGANTGSEIATGKCF